LGLAVRARLDLAAVSLGLAACAAAVEPPAPPPFAGDRAAPVTPITEPSAPPPEPPAPAPPVTPTVAPVALAAPQVNLAIEPPFRLDRRVFPTTKAAFLADLADRTRWNKGGLGAFEQMPPVPGHPLPKVILDVTRATGPRAAPALQRELRRSFWSKAVECFSLGAYKDQKLRGTTTLSLVVAPAGQVRGAQVTATTFQDPDVNACLTDRARKVALPAAKARSLVTMALQLGHGDEPVPPPGKLVVPGDGELSPEVIRAVIEAARPELEGCFRLSLPYLPELWGRLGIRFHVTEKGKTDEAFEVESTFPDELARLCVLRAARKLTFPTPAGGDLRFVVPLRFWSDRSVVAQPGGGEK
jgi:hypothetical protein